jgi:hypothetical protein
MVPGAQHESSGRRLFQPELKTASIDRLSPHPTDGRARGCYHFERRVFSRA